MSYEDATHLTEKNTLHKAGVCYWFTSSNFSSWWLLQRFGWLNLATSFHSLIKKNESSTKLLRSTLHCACIIICKLCEFDKKTVAIKPTDTSANLEGHHPFFFTSFVHKCNVIDVHALKRDTRQWLDHCKQDEDWGHGPSLYTLLVPNFDKYPILPIKQEPLLWNLKQTSVLLQLFCVPQCKKH